MTEHVGAWLSGAPMAELDEDAVRAAFVAQGAEVQKLASAYEDALRMLGATAAEWMAEGTREADGWHADRFWHGYMMGRAEALLRLARVIEDHASAMRLRAHAAGGEHE